MYPIAAAEQTRGGKRRGRPLQVPSAPINISSIKVPSTHLSLLRDSPNLQQSSQTQCQIYSNCAAESSTWRANSHLLPLQGAGSKVIFALFRPSRDAFAFGSPSVRERLSTSAISGSSVDHSLPVAKCDGTPHVPEAKPIRAQLFSSLTSRHKGYWV